VGDKTPTLAEVIQAAIKAELLAVNVCLPAKVEKYDAEAQKANISLLLKKKYIIDEEPTALPVITNVPVQWLSANGGESFIHLPLKAGDTGAAIFSQRSLDTWLAGEGEAVNPDDPRHHDLSDAIFIPGVLPFKKALQGINANNLMIKNGKALIEEFPDGKIQVSDGGGGQVELDGGTINITGGAINLGAGVEKAVLGDTLKTLYGLHTHLSASPGSPSSIPSNILDTALSNKVNLD
jgi:hypothetical protein